MAFEQRTHIVDLLGVTRGHEGDRWPLERRDGHEALSFELAQRLPQRSAADLQRL
jgi:hypothetical protein